MSTLSHREGISYMERERRGGKREEQLVERAGQQAGIFKVRLGLGEIER